VYFEDLSPYQYGGPVEPGVLNVGWLDADHPFEVGGVDESLVARLIRLAGSSTRNVYRGWHNCELCDIESPIVLPCSDAPSGKVWLGHSEILVPAPGGGAYAAPTLLIHCISNHQYQPPAEFVAAVNRTALT
jgi:hypothetical protein